MTRKKRGFCTDDSLSCYNIIVENRKKLETKKVDNLKKINALKKNPEKFNAYLDKYMEYLKNVENITNVSREELAERLLNPRLNALDLISNLGCWGNRYKEKKYEDIVAPTSLRRKLIADYEQKRFKKVNLYFELTSGKKGGLKNNNTLKMTEEEYRKYLIEKNIESGNYLMLPNPVIRRSSFKDEEISILERIAFDFDDGTYEESYERLERFFKNYGSVYGLSMEMFKLHRSSSGKMHAFLEITPECAQYFYTASNKDKRINYMWAKDISRKIHDLFEYHVGLKGDSTFKGVLQHAMYVINLPIPRKGMRSSSLAKMNTETINFNDLIENLLDVDIDRDFKKKREEDLAEELLAARRERLNSIPKIDRIKEKLEKAGVEHDWSFTNVFKSVKKRFAFKGNMFEEWNHLKRNIEYRVKTYISLNAKEREESNLKAWKSIICFAIGHSFKYKKHYEMRDLLLDIFDEKREDIISHFNYALRNKNYQYSNYNPT